MSRKKKIVLFGIIICLLSIFLIINNVDLKNTEGKKIAFEFKSINGKRNGEGNKYPIVLMSNKNKFKYLSYDSFMKLFDEQKNAVVYVGNPYCLNCRHVIEVLDYTSRKSKIDVVYYLDYSKLNGYEHEEIFELLGDGFINEYEGKKYLDVPFVLFVKNGMVVSSHNGTIPYHDPYENLTNEQKKLLEDIYYFGYRDVLAE